MLAGLANAVPAARAAYYRGLSPLYFRKVGRGSLFFGALRLGRPFARIWIGENNMIGHGVFMQTGRTSEIRIGSNCSVNSFCHLVAAAAITIGDNVAIGELVSIRDQEHRFHPDMGVREQGFDVAPIVIEDNVWIGRGVYIGPGSHIRRGSIVGANSVVRGEFPPNVLIAGTPAVVKKVLA